MFLASCGSDMQLFWPTEDDKPDYAQGGGRGAGAPSRAPLDVPPELRDEIEVPSPGDIATKDGVMRSEEEKKLVAGKAVALDAKIYEKTPAEVFSAVVDSMTALNLPVQSVDSPSGTLTTDWVRQASVSSEAVSTLTNMFGAGGARALRYRFVVRVFRQTMGESGQVTRLEVRTIGQAFIGTTWVSKPIKRKVSNELFAAVDERLSN